MERSQYRMDPKSLKGLSDSEKKFLNNPKVVKAIWGPEAYEKNKLKAFKLVYKSWGLLPKDF